MTDFELDGNAGRPASVDAAEAIDVGEQTTVKTKRRT